MKRKIIILIVLLAIVGAGGMYAWKEYDRPVEGAGGMTAVETTSAAELLKAFQTDENAANKRFVGISDQAVQVSGTIRSIEPAAEGRVNVILETGDALAGVVCEFKEADVPAGWSAGANVEVKGICTGMLLDVVLVRCAAVERSLPE
jgi:hypothetical protein